MTLQFQPLGDQAIMAYFADEALAFRFAAALRQRRDAWLVDVVHAYTSVAVFFDLDRIQSAAVRHQLETVDLTSAVVNESRLHRIPCCYDLNLDLDRVAASTGLQPDEVVRQHAATEYTVYAIGFCPGFPYLGYLPSALQGVPRLPSPRVRLEAGSVGLTGKQTGIYTEARPGGWNIIGRTPLQLVDVSTGYFPLRTGDRVRFEPIEPPAFERLQGQRLTTEGQVTSSCRG